MEAWSKLGVSRARVTQFAKMRLTMDHSNALEVYSCVAHLCAGSGFKNHG